MAYVCYCPKVVRVFAFGWSVWEVGQWRWHCPSKAAMAFRQSHAREEVFQAELGHRLH